MVAASERDWDYVVDFETGVARPGPAVSARVLVTPEDSEAIVKFKRLAQHGRREVLHPIGAVAARGSVR